MERNKQYSVEEFIEKSSVHYEQRNYQKSREMLERVLEIRTKQLGEDDVAVAWALHEIGNVLWKEESLNDALEKFNRALPIRVEKLGRHCDTAETYTSIGNILKSQDHDEKAEEMFRKALDMKRELLSNDHPDVTDLCLYLAKALKKQGKYSEAIKVQKLQLAKLLEMRGEDHPGVVLIYNGIAELLQIQHRSDDALRLLDLAIEICNRLEIKKSLVTTLRHKANILNEEGDFEASAAILTKVIMVQIETDGEMHPKTAQVYEDLAIAYIQQDMIEGATKACAKAIKIRRKELGNDHPKVKELALTLGMLDLQQYPRELNEQGLAMKAVGESEKAVQLFQDALDIYEETSHIDPFSAAVYENLSAVKVDQGLLEDAIAASAEALKIRRRTLGDDHFDTKRRMEAHRSLLKRLLENRS
ncbi:unnamed protein product [Cylindrotheca closterium]|uniref:Kinesin light chain n=1 Tax=Cylindrotheca closterium TaxID=2856 RepID=A0AAD2PXV1_9STRA|nr:unnamed protein product [Cylindrotheca closterium]